jgi:hypothetical protein
VRRPPAVIDETTTTLDAARDRLRWNELHRVLATGLSPDGRRGPAWI